MLNGNKHIINVLDHNNRREKAQNKAINMSENSKKEKANIKIKQS